jgi:23S rRNA pseudouridine2605 synthase
MHVLKPVGRLDKDSSGILLLTNDGDFAHTMTHPSFAKTKHYRVTLDKPLEPLHQQMISDYGVEIGDGASKLSLERQDDTRLEWIVVMNEGRNRQIRRTFAALGYDVTELHRFIFGPYELGTLASGEFETVSKY